MADQEQVEQWRRAYEKETDAELYRIKHSFVDYAPQHIAAVQELDRRAKLSAAESAKTTVQQHLESLAQEQRLHRSTQRIAWIALFVAIISLLIAILALWEDSRPGSVPSLVERIRPSSPSTPAAEKQSPKQ